MMLDFYQAEGSPHPRYPVMIALAQPELESRLREHQLPQRYLRLRRVLELLAIVSASPLLLGVCAVIALAVLMESGRPVLFVQARPGRNGRMFRMMKFRTMRNDRTDHDAPLTGELDERVTMLGGFLRRHRLDELPQLWNVMKGEMSMIGPRPESAEVSDLFLSNIPLYAFRRIILPGISGWAQVTQGYAPDLESMRRTVEHDLYYIMNISPWLDARIVLRTLRCIVTGQGAR